MPEEIPTIVFVGDRSSGKSSVLESLAGISLSRGKCNHTRVPLIVRLQDDPFHRTPRVHLEYKNKRIESSESSVTGAIEIATYEVAGSGRGYSDTPVTVVVRKKGAPNLTLVDLPGIIHVPTRGQPENICEKLSCLIIKYIKPADSIILNVVSAGVSFPTCESIRLSKLVDSTGERTLAVVTKADESPEGLLEKITADDVNIGLGYICVRNRTGSESFEEARASEAELFESHHLLSRIDKSIVGIPVLAQRLMKIQAQINGKCLPDIMKEINYKLTLSVSELDGMPPNLVSIPDPMIALVKESLRKLLIRREFEDYPNENQTQGPDRLSEMLNAYAKDLPADFPSNGGFLVEEIAILEETKVIGFPNFLHRTAFATLLQRRLKDASTISHDLVSKVWSYTEEAVLRALREAAANYPNLQVCTQRNARNLADKMRKKSHDFVTEHIEMEKTTNYTYSPSYMELWAELTYDKKAFTAAVCDHSLPTKMTVRSVGVVDVSHLRGKHKELVKQAFDIRMMLISYWKCVAFRLVDAVALHLRYAVKMLVDRELESEIVNGGGRRV